MFTFTPLYGAQSTSKASASILEFDGGVKVLVDIGWDAHFSSKALKELEKHVPTISLVLLTHATIEHIGAYVHACKHIPLFSRIPVYATIPVVNLGLTLLTDLYASSVLAASTIPADALGGEDEDTPSLLLLRPSNEETSKYFNHITPLKYSQPHQPSPVASSPPLGGLTITAYAAGHTLGGTIWHLQHSLESVVYAADWNQTRENLLGGAAWLSSASGGAEVIEPLRKPTALICSSRGVEFESATPTRRKRDEALIALIRDTIVQGGKVLIPTDSSARVLELAFLLNQAWRDGVDGPHAATYKNAKVYMASKSASATQRYLQSMLEWMDDSVIRNAEAAMTSKGKEKTNPLEWDHVHVIERQSQLDRALKRPKSSVILASDTSLEWGYAQHALKQLAGTSDNLIILTERQTAEDTLGSSVWNTFRDTLSDPASTRSMQSHEITYRKPTTDKLDEKQEEIYTQYLAQQSALSAAPEDTTSAEADPTLLDAAADDSSDSEDEEVDADAQHQGRVLNLSSQLASSKRKGAELETGIDLLLSGKAYDFEVQGKRGRERLYPFRQSRKRNDDFGEPIVVTDYLRAEEKEEIEAAAVEDRKVGEKRKWEDVTATTTALPARNLNKRLKAEEKTERLGNGDTGDSGSESGESEYEPDESEDSAAPKQVAFKDVTITVSARCRYVDFSAMRDKRDLLMLIPLIRPRKLILYGGSESETKTLAEDARKLLQGRSNGVKKESSQSEVFTPINGESVDASVDTNAWTLKLGRNLLRKLVWQDIRGIGIVALSGMLSAQEEKVKEEEAEEDAVARKKRKLEGPAKAGGDEDAESLKLPILDVPETTKVAKTLVQTSKPVHVGDLRLSDLRNLLRASNHTADFRGEGTLLVDGIVVVRKGSNGRIEVEGNVFGTGGRGAIGEIIFDDVKRKIYQGLAVVGAGTA